MTAHKHKYPKPNYDCFAGELGSATYTPPAKYITDNRVRYNPSEAEINQVTSTSEQMAAK